MDAWTGRERWLGVVLATGLLGCGQATARMRAGVPIDVQRGYCFVNTQFKQGGHTLDRDDVLSRLAKNEKTGPDVEQGNTLAVGAIAATVVATPAILVGSLAKEGDIHMNDNTSTALLAGGIVVGVASWALCIASDGKYAAAVTKYNENFTQPRDPDDDHANY